MQEEAGSCIAVLVDRRTGQEYNISRFATSIGREIGNDIVLVSDKTISRQHAVVQYVDGKFLLQDLGSKNGSRLNGQKIQGLTEMRSGDEICLGLTQYMFVLIPGKYLNMPIRSARTETVAEPAQEGIVAGR